MTTDEEYTYYYIPYDGDEVVPEINVERSIAVEHLRDAMRMQNTSDKLRQRAVRSESELVIDQMRLEHKSGYLDLEPYVDTDNGAKRRGH